VEEKLPRNNAGQCTLPLTVGQQIVYTTNNNIPQGPPLTAIADGSNMGVSKRQTVEHPCFSWGAWSTGKPEGHPCWLTESQPEFTLTTSTITAPSQVYAVHVYGRSLVTGLPVNATNGTSGTSSTSSTTSVTSSIFAPTINTIKVPVPFSTPSEAVVGNLTQKTLSQGQLIGIIFGGIIIFLFGCVGSCVWLYRYKHREMGLPRFEEELNESSHLSELKRELPGHDSRFEIEGRNTDRELMPEGGPVHELYTREHILELSVRNSRRVSYR
jgi:hypothetical protein